MTYVISDIHGCFDLYSEMLSKIDLKSEDTLYVLGDVIDRGPDGIKILKDIMSRKNVIMLRGNHEDMAMKVFKNYIDSNFITCPRQYAEDMKLWFDNEGEKTFEDFKKLSYDEQKEIIEFLDSLYIFYRKEINGKKYFISHSLPSLEKYNGDDWEVSNFIWDRPNYNQIYDENITFVTGHTPTALIDRTQAGRIISKNNHIAIDCGAVFFDRLGCVCLDTLKEYYAVKENEEYDKEDVAA